MYIYAIEFSCFLCVSPKPFDSSGKHRNKKSLILQRTNIFPKSTDTQHVYSELKSQSKL